MAGLEVSRSNLDQKVAEAIIAVRRSFRQVDRVNGFLSNNPSNAVDGDLLTKDPAEGGFGYTADEAYLIRVTFEQLTALDVEGPLELGRKLTGLD